MSKYKEADFSKAKLYNLEERKNKEEVSQFSKLDNKVVLLKDEGLQRLAKRIVQAHKDKKMVIFMMGGHPIKCGLSLYLIDLIKKRVVKHIAMNGACIIHDFEIALQGKTSEDVEENLPKGTFGMWRETGKINDIINENENLGIGEAVGKYILEGNLKFKGYSILAAAYENNVPATVHVAIGSDIIHVHPNFDGAKTGHATTTDLKIFTDSVAKLEGGVVVNIGSAVVMPEVFLKARSFAINTGHKGIITTANVDMLDHYRPRVNVLQRQVSQGGEMINIKARHEQIIPTLYKLIIEGIK